MRRSNRRRILIPEVVQTSAMDCGAASLKCLLEGYGITVSYGRLREICHTSVDGTSIETVEQVAAEFGFEAEQIMLPSDHVLLPEARALPAIAVVRNEQGLNHFVVIWRFHSCGFVQVMDPAVGRRWLKPETLRHWLYDHTTAVGAADWRVWAGSEEFVGCLQRRLRNTGISRDATSYAADRALEDKSWRSLASLYAAARMADSIRRSGGPRGDRANARLLESLFEQIRVSEFTWDESSPKTTWSICPPEFWPVLPAPPDPRGEDQLLLRGAVLVRVRRRHAEHQHRRQEEDADTGRVDTSENPTSTLTTELVAARDEPPNQAVRGIFCLLRADGLFSPIMLVKALFLAAAAVTMEAVLFRSLIDIGSDLYLTEQRIAAIGILATFLLAVLMLNVPIFVEVRRLGRHLEVRLRVAILAKLARLDDRYLRSRLTSDMAERSHSVHLLQRLPGLAGQLLSSIFQLLLTTAGIIWIAPTSAIPALTAAAFSAVLPLLAQPVFAERDFRARNLGGALCRFYLDAMLGLMPVRAHTAERAIRDTHERLLIEWTRAGLKMQHIAVALDTLQFVVGYALAIWLLLANVVRPGQAGSLLLLVYWSLSLPIIGQTIALSVRQYPVYRNVTLRLLEPLAAPEQTRELEPDKAQASTAAGKNMTTTIGATVAFENTSLTVAGHAILQEVTLAISAGTHVAIVGPSGAGKSSLVGLLLGWSPASSGRILVDGTPLDSQRLTKLREETAWVDPAVQLWNRSVLDNLRYGTYSNDATALEQAISIAELWELLENRSDGLQSSLGESGSLVSGGEGQRVRFARALLRKQARLVILDEPFSGLDRPRRERLLRSARLLWRSATLLYITHDVAEAAGFSRVLVLKAGRVIEDGSPADLAYRPGAPYQAMLDAESAARANFASRKNWRRLQLDRGRLRELTADRQLPTGVKSSPNDGRLSVPERAFAAEVFRESGT